MHQRAQEVEGEVLALDAASGLVTLKQPGSTPFHSNLRVLRIDQITARGPALPCLQYHPASYHDGS